MKDMVLKSSVEHKRKLDEKGCAGRKRKISKCDFGG